MEFNHSPQNKKNKSPVLTIKRTVRQTGQWQDFIDREQSTVDHILQDSFAAFCRELKENSTPKANYHHTIGGYKVRKQKSASSAENSPPGSAGSPEKFGMSHGTLPRNMSGTLMPRNMSGGTLPRMPKTLFKDPEDSDGLHLPPGIAELEQFYAPMKNLSKPLPSFGAGTYSEKMPIPHPLANWNEIESFKNRTHNKREDDAESEICSVIIPPPLAPVQSHAILENSLGHKIPIGAPRTPARTAKFSCPPPILPARQNSKLTMINTSKPNSQIYANLNRSSLMSTGSSEESSGSSDVMSPSAMTSSSTAASENIFAWPNYSIRHSPSPSPSSNITEEHRSVSQIGEPPDSASEAGSSSNNTAYVKMNRRDSNNDFVIYEDAASYVDMKMPNVKRLQNANMDAISSIYARPQSVTSSIASHSRKSTSSACSSKSKKVTSEFKLLMQEVAKKRQFRVGLNLFNSRPEVGIEFLASKGFIDLSPESVGKFLFNTNGLSMEKIGHYLGSLQSPFAMKTLSCFMQEFDFSGQRMDKALRIFLRHVRVPGEAQKIERIMEVFGKRFAQCNPGFVSKLKSSDSIVTLAFAIILLNTDLHTPNLKSEKKMQVQDFVNNLRGVDGGRNFDPKLLKQIYKGIKKQEFVTAVDHVAQVQALQNSILNEQGKNFSQQIAQPHRRLVCICRLFEVMNINSRKEPASGSHQRDLFLFNDLLIVSKMTSKGTKNSGPVYTQRLSFPLRGLEVTLFHTPVFEYGIQISRKNDGSVLVTLNAGSEHDRYKIVMDLQESIYEMDQMEEAAQSLSM